MFVPLCLFCTRTLSPVCSVTLSGVRPTNRTLCPFRGCDRRGRVEKARPSEHHNCVNALCFRVSRKRQLLGRFSFAEMRERKKMKTKGREESCPAKRELMRQIERVIDVPAPLCSSADIAGGTSPCTISGSRSRNVLARQSECIREEQKEQEWARLLDRWP